MNKPKVLLLGYNYASVMNSLHAGFEEIGVPCKSMSFELHRSIFNHYDHIDSVYPKEPVSRLRIHWLRAKGFAKLLKYLAWCDVLHVFYDTAISGSRIELKLFGLTKKKKFINFLGSEVRNPEVSAQINPYFAEAFQDPGYEYKQESKKNSDQLQRMYAQAGFVPIVWDTDIYINTSIFPKYFIIPHASLNHLPPSEKKADGPVLIVHSPSAPVAKGTKYVLKAIEELERRGVKNFEFKLLQNIPNNVYQEFVSRADILIDQMVWGAYGIASAQALAYGKVVVCYLLPQRVDNYYGKDCPIVNANADNLPDVLEELIKNESMRNSLAEKGRDYYQKTHAPAVVAKKMLAAYTHKQTNRA
ncbi:MAG: glycosyltransferase [Flavisolibacter sp.]